MPRCLQTLSSPSRHAARPRGTRHAAAGTAALPASGSPTRLAATGTVALPTRSSPTRLAATGTVALPTRSSPTRLAAAGTAALPATGSPTRHAAAGTAALPASRLARAARGGWDSRPPGIPARPRGSRRLGQPPYRHPARPRGTRRLGQPPSRHPGSSTRHAAAGTVALPARGGWDSRPPPCDATKKRGSVSRTPLESDLTRSRS
jgi:hypothetical protein